MITILKKLRHLPVLGLVAIAAVLSVMLGCGGEPPGTRSGNSSFTVDISSANGGSAGLVALTIRNDSTGRFISQVTFLKSAVLDADGNVITPAERVDKVFNPAIPPGGAVAGVILYNAPSGNFLGAVTTGVVASDATGMFSQGYNLKLDFDRTSVKITPADGTFSFQ